MKFQNNWQIYSISPPRLVFYPSVLQTAKVIPIFKTDSNLDSSNYRPISLLSNIGKILEKRMYRRLCTYVSNKNIIYELKFGFRQQYSTSHASINITKNIKKLGCEVFVDLQKAFDHYGIPGVSNDWFESYLSNCSQYISLNGYESSLAVINCSVLQGSVLGPLLFLLHINDLNQAIKFGKVHHFADGTNLSCHSNSIKKLNKLVNTD